MSTLLAERNTKTNLGPKTFLRSYLDPQTLKWQYIHKALLSPFSKAAATPKTASALAHFLEMKPFLKIFSKMSSSFFLRMIEVEELVGATFCSSITTVEVLLGFTNGFLHGAAPKSLVLQGFSRRFWSHFLAQVFLWLRSSALVPQN